MLNESPKPPSSDSSNFDIGNKNYNTFHFNTSVDDPDKNTFAKSITRLKTYLSTVYK